MQQRRTDVRVARRIHVALASWLKNGAWSVADQALFAGSNFVLNILLARWLSPSAYGAYTLAYTLFLLLGLFHTALLAEPMLVFGRGRFREKLRPYTETVLTGHVAFAGFGVVAMGLAAIGFRLADAREMETMMVTLAVAQPFILFMWLMRQTCYVRMMPGRSASGGVLYTALVLVGTYGLYETSRLSAVTALLLMALASLAAGAWLAAFLKVRPRRPAITPIVREASREHWKYGRWATATGVLTWITGKVAYILLPIAAGLETTAAFRALVNLIMPAIHVYAAFSVILVPMLVEARASGTLRRKLRLSLGVVSLAMVSNWLLLGFFGESLLNLLYDGQYDEFAPVLWVLGGVPLLSGFVAVLGAALRALELPKKIFRAYVGASLAVLTLGMALIFSFGLVGTVLAQAVGPAIAAVAMWRILRSRPAAPPAIRPARTSRPAETQTAPVRTASPVTAPPP